MRGGSRLGHVMMIAILIVLLAVLASTLFRADRKGSESGGESVLDTPKKTQIVPLPFD